MYVLLNLLYIIHLESKVLRFIQEINSLLSSTLRVIGKFFFRLWDADLIFTFSV